MRTDELDLVEGALPWWRRDLPFPRFWPNLPLLYVGAVGATLLCSVLWSPLGAVAYCFGWLGGLMLLWGPRGLARPTADPRLAWQRAAAVGAAAMAPFLVYWALT